MSNYIPPYTISTKIVNLISKISEELTKLEFNSPQVIAPLLRKKNRVRTLAGTLEIEGNYLGEDKITAILDGKRVLGTMREVTEVEGAINAYKELENYKYRDINDLLQAHKILMSGILTTAGEFRNINVAVGDHVAPPFARVNELMQELFSWLNTSEENPLIKSCIFHYEFEFIHPFSDGNGRIGRLWQSVILYNYHELFASLPTESIVRDYQEEYYKALEDSSTAGESTPFIEFMLDMILKSIEKVGKEVGNKVGNLTDNQIAIIKKMQDEPKIGAKILSEHVGISIRKIEENVAKLKKMDIIERVGGTRGYWIVK